MGFVRVKNVYILRVFFAESEFVRVRHPQNLRVFSTKPRFVRVKGSNYIKEYGIIGNHTTAGDPHGFKRSNKEAVFKGV